MIASPRAAQLIGCGLLLLAAVACTAQPAPATPSAHPGDSPGIHRILARGSLLCGVDSTEAEYTSTDDHGPRLAFDTALCRAVAVALLGPHAHFAVQSFPDDSAAVRALLAGTVDLVPTLSADLQHTTDPAITLTTPVLHDAVTLLVPDSANITTAADTAGKKICFLSETETEVALQDWSRAQHVAYLPFPFQEQGEMEAAFVTNNCAAMAGDATRLGAVRASLGRHATAYHLLPGSLRDDPLAMAVRADDTGLLRVAQWTFQALLLAEANGITSANAAAFPSSQSAVADRLLGRTQELGRPLGLREPWALDVITAVGNYGELFARTLGADSPTALPRGANTLCAAAGPTPSPGALCPLPLK